MKKLTPTPTQEQFQTVIDTFESVFEKYNKNCPVNMYLDNTNYCGTPMCHAGWYAVAKDAPPESGYTHGATLLANDLGFENKYELKNWAHENPEIWGNKHGCDMFILDRAFGFGAHPLEGKIPHLGWIIAHWRGVKERALKFEQS